MSTTVEQRVAELYPVRIVYNGNLYARHLDEGEWHWLMLPLDYAEIGLPHLVKGATVVTIVDD